jgi:hypothetical protein
MKNIFGKYTFERIKQSRTPVRKVKLLHKCLRCPAMISGSAKYCKPCSEDVRHERSNGKKPIAI